MKRIISRVILWVLVVLMWGCPNDTQTRYVGLEGKIIIRGDVELGNIWIGVPVYSTDLIYPRYNQLWDSTLTDSDGSYYLGKAVPEGWENTTGCSVSPTYFGMGEFALLIVPENRDTAFVLFYSDSSYYDPNRISVEPRYVFIGEHHFGGEPGNVREAPVITLEY